MHLRMYVRYVEVNKNGGVTNDQKIFGITNVSWARDLPNDPRLIKVNLRMNLYIHRNVQINHIFQQFAVSEDIVPYLIDESLISNATHLLRELQHGETVVSIEGLVMRLDEEQVLLQVDEHTY